MTKELWKRIVIMLFFMFVTRYVGLYLYELTQKKDIKDISLNYEVYHLPVTPTVPWVYKFDGQYLNGEADLKRISEGDVIVAEINTASFQADTDKPHAE